MRILVTGAAGFIGSHLAERISFLGHDVEGLDCLTDFYARSLKEDNLKALSGKGIKVRQLDLAKDDISHAVQEMDIIFHLAAQPSISPDVHFTEYWKNNVLATHNLLESVKHSPSLKVLVYVSSSSVYGANAGGSETSEPKPVSVYGVTKLAAEQFVLARTRNNNLPGCSVRLFSVYGPRERPDKLYFQLIRCALENKPFNLFRTSAEHMRSYTYVDDAVLGLTLVLDNIDRCPGEIFNIGSETAVSTAEGIMMVEKILGKKISINTIAERAGDQIRTRANIGKARSLLGYQPSTSLYEGLEREVEWFREFISKKL